MNSEQFSRKYFEDNYLAALNIGDQNDRYQAAMQDPTFDGFEDMRDTVVSDLGDEQTDTIYDLGNINLDPYEQLGLEYEATVKEIDNLRNSLGLDQAKLDMLKRAAARAVELSPRSAQDIERLEKLHETEIEALSKLEKEQKLGQLSVRLNQLEALSEVADKAWPAPLIPTDKRSLMLVEEYPYDPPEVENRTDSIRGRLEQHGRLSGASLEIAVLMLENPGHSFVTRELGTLLYGEDEYVKSLSENDRNELYSRRIACLLNPKSISNDLTSALASEGYKVQYGRLTIVDRRTGKLLKGTGPRRLYRTASVNETESNEEFTQEMVVDGDENVTSKPEDSAEVREETIDSSVGCPELAGVDLRAKMEKLQELGLLPETRTAKISARKARVRLLNVGLRQTNFGKYIASFDGKSLSPEDILTLYVGEIPKSAWRDASRAKKIALKLAEAVDRFYDDQEYDAQTA